MIRDAEKLEAIRASWETVRTVQSMLQTHSAAPALSPFGLVRPPEYDNVASSLLVLFAFSVLEDALKTFCSQGSFASKFQTLHSLMEGSTHSLTWVDYSSVDSARLVRNKIAHKQIMLPPTRCNEIVDLIETELVGWRVLAHPIKVRYTVSIGNQREAGPSSALDEEPK